MSQPVDQQLQNINSLNDNGKPEEMGQSNPLAGLQNSIFMSIGLANLPEFHGSPSENIDKFLSEFGRATTALTQEQKCLALKKALVGDANVFVKNYLKQQLLQGDWKFIKQTLRKRFSNIEPSLLYRTELNKMSFNPEKHTLLGYVDNYAKLYRKIHTEAKDIELIQDISLNLGNNIVLKLNQLSSNWKTLDNFEMFRDLISRLEKDILTLESSIANINASELTSTVNKLVTAALVPPIKDIKELVTQLIHKPKEETKSENVAAVKHGQYPEASDNRQKRDTGKRRERDWEDEQDRYRYVYKRAKELKKMYEDKYGEVSGPCYYCGGQHFRRHCPFCEMEQPNLKDHGDRR